MFTNNDIYHEKQWLMLCGVHALNNAFQKQLFTKADFDEKCLELESKRFANSYRNIFGLGNYDVNVLMEIVQSKGYSLQWINCKRDFKKFLNVDFIVAFLVNKSQPYRLLNMLNLPISGRHWVCYKYIDNYQRCGYYNLDSKLPSPKFETNNHDEFLELLQHDNKNNDCHIFAIVTNEVAASNKWFNEAD